MTPGIADFWLRSPDGWTLAACIVGTLLLALAIRGPSYIRELKDYRVKMREQDRLDRVIDARLMVEQREQERRESLADSHIRAVAETLQRLRIEAELPLEIPSRMGISRPAPGDRSKKAALIRP
jgi:hypothetical protein